MKFLMTIASAMVLSQSVHAAGLQIHGTQSHQLREPNTPIKTLKRYNQSQTRTIQLLNVQLSPQLRSNISVMAETIDEQFDSNQDLNSNPKPAVQLAMNGLPVLDQGPYGTCVTFANSAAIDVLINQGDYISQVCQLQLGNYLEQNGFYPSGWVGSLGPIVLNQMMQFGVMNKTNEHEHGCGGLYSYPRKGQPSSYEMPLEQYHYYSEDLMDKRIYWTPILNAQEVNFSAQQAEQVVKNIKQSLAQGDRVTFGVLLFNFEQGTMGAVGSYKSNYDTWLLTPEFIHDLKGEPEFGGHEMVITGYDDDAVAYDKSGRKYTGLFTLRNSWGSKVGDHGDFYMSYDYFKLLTIEAQRLSKQR